MPTLRLDPGERLYWHWPVTGTAAILQIKVGAADFAPMELADGYTPDPVIEGATWYRTLFAHPDATSNPAGTYVVATATLVMIRVAVSPQLVVESGWVIVGDLGLTGATGTAPSTIDGGNATG